MGFFFSYRWVSSPDNNISWKLPAPKLPNEFYIASQVAGKIKELHIPGEVLAHRDIAAWLPLTLPGVRLVMPGHTYPIQLQTILPKNEFDSRMALFNVINNGVAYNEGFSRSLVDMNVGLIIIPNSMEKNFSSWHFRSLGRNYNLEKIESFSGYSLYKVISAS